MIVIIIQNRSVINQLEICPMQCFLHLADTFSAPHHQTRLNMKAKTLSLWGATFFGSVVLGYKMPPFAVLRQFTEDRLPDHKKDPLTSRLYTKAIEKEMLTLPLVKKMSQNPHYEMSRAWKADEESEDVAAPSTETALLPTPPPSRSSSPAPAAKKRSGEVFTADTLKVPGGISGRPLVFTNKEDKSAVIIVHVGHKVTGFPMIVHGGILATLLDEALGRTAFMSFPAGVGVTANLSLQYKAPSIAHQFLVIRTQTGEVNSTGTKASVSGTVETLKGKRLVESSAIFVVPKKFQLRRLEDI